MTPPKNKQATVTNAERANAERLRALWNKKAKRLGLTQESAGDVLGMNQSAVSQYLNGRIPLGLEATLNFAALLRVDAREINPDLTAAMPQSRPDSRTSAPDFAHELAKILAEVPDTLRPTVGKLLQSIAQSPADETLRNTLTSILASRRKRA